MTTDTLLTEAADAFGRAAIERCAAECDDYAESCPAARVFAQQLAKRIRSIEVNSRVWLDANPSFARQLREREAKAEEMRRYATAEVARLAGQAVDVRWEARMNDKSPWVSITEHGVQSHRDAGFEVRALGVIATSSAPIHWYCRKCGWVGIPSDSTP